MATVFEAAATGDIGKMNGYLDADDFDIDAKDANGMTALHHAARSGEAASGGLLVECDANVDIADADGNTPLHYAGIYNHRLVASMLLWGGADRNLLNSKGNTALHEATIKGAKDVAWLIVENGGDQTVLVKNKDGKTPADLSKDLPPDVGQNGELIEMLDSCYKEMEEKIANKETLD
eukprot:TRINITY_DN14864_c1_g1_i1.p1 TRINITY_DN14864_c1_g1~~TRINITY_DN14864_c1_g1_i1.p1  ORF type:complete len:194 (+),score=50.17 TRINITY_DN14864_c1_g1_i1:51-584(+)